MVEHITSIVNFIGGLGMFFYGVETMSASMQKAVGERFKNVLKTITKNPFLSLLLGALMTIVIQSSSTTTIMVIAFVNAGVIELTKAVPVIMGANVGTTVTSWIIALTQVGGTSSLINPSFYAPLILGISSLVITFNKKEKVKNIGSIFLGVAFLFMGLVYMSRGIKPYASSSIFINSFRILGRIPILAILIGAVVTAILQSSTTSITILQTLALSGEVNKSAAIFIMMGQNIGTCFASILSSTNGNKNAKRAALIHLFFNLFGVLFFSLLILITYPFIKDILNSRISLFEISLFHTGFNVTNTVLLFPFSDKLVALTKIFVKDDDSEEVRDLDILDTTKNILDDRILEQPELALVTITNEVTYFAKYTLKNVKRACKLMVVERNDESIAEISTYEDLIDDNNRILNDYLAKVNNLFLTNRQHIIVEHLLSICSDIERMGDHAENISENAKDLLEEGADFSEFAKKELTHISEVTIKCVESAIKALEKKNIEDVKNVRQYESEVDDLRDEYKQEHIKRLSSGMCKTLPGIAFLDTIGNLERITDHANNIADYVEDEIKNFN